MTMRTLPCISTSAAAALVVVSALAATLLLAQPAPALASEDTAPGATAAQETATHIVAYYFHGNFRCATCRKLEAYSEEAITKGFEKEIESGRLTWRTVNTDEKENKHFVKDFELVTKSLVLVEYNGDEVVRYKNLKVIWQLVGDKGGFLTYVREATREMLGEA
jgi:hypothetical protein